MKLQWADIEKRFSYHRPSNDRVAMTHETVRSTLKNATHQILDAIPEGREASVFVTKMEEAMFWANAAIARNQ